MSQNSVNDESLESIAVWYQCKICLGLFYSIPKFIEHTTVAHPNQRVNIPVDRLRPGAKDGKIYYYHNRPNDLPSPKEYPYSQLIASREEEPNPTEQTIPPSSSPPQVTSDKDFGIRVCHLEDLTEQSEEEVTIQNNVPFENEQRKSPSPSPLATPIASPSDSGIQIGSEIQEDEVPQPPPVRIVSTGPVPIVPEKRTYANVVNSNIPATDTASTSTASTNNEEPVPSTSKALPGIKKKFKCSMCTKEFSTISSLNFHLRKLHHVEEGEINPPAPAVPTPSSEKVILKILRDSTGNFTSKNNQSIESENVIQKSTQRPRQASVSSSVSDCTTVAPTRKVVNPAPESIEKSANVGKSSNRNPTSRKPGPRSKTFPKETPRPIQSESESESVIGRSKRTKVSRLELSSSDESDNDAKTTSCPSVPSPPHTMLIRRNLRKRPSKQAEKDDITSSIQNQPRYNTRTKRPKKASPSSSESEASNDDNSDNDEVGIGEKDITNTDDESLPPPALTRYGLSDDDTENLKKGTKKNARTIDPEEDCEEEEDMDSDSDDLFEMIKVTKHRKNKSEKTGESRSAHAKAGTSKNVKKPTKKSNKSDVNSKLAKGNSSTTTTFRCKFSCSFQTNNAFDYIKHIYKEHEKERLVYDCGNCGQKFNTHDDTYDEYENHGCPKTRKAKK